MIYPYLHPIQVAQPPRRRRPKQSHQASLWPWMINDSLRSLSIYITHYQTILDKYTALYNITHIIDQM